MEENKNVVPPIEPPEVNEQFPGFLDGFVTFTKSYTNNAYEIVADPEMTRVMSVYGNAAIEAVSQLRDELRSWYSALAQDEKTLVERQLRLSAGRMLVADANSLIGERIIAAPAPLGLASLIAEIIKKIIRMIFEIFGIPMPHWLEALLELIDELIKTLLPFFSREAADIHHEFERQVLVIRRLTREMKRAA